MVDSGPLEVATIVTSGKIEFDAPAGPRWLWRIRATLGHPLSQVAIAHSCAQRGDDAAAVRWLRRVGNAIPKAQVYLGSLLVLAHGRNPDPRYLAEAAQVTREAAEAGCVEGQQVLTSFYLHGEGVPRSLERAFHWALVAARNGSLDAWQFLIESHLDGKFLEPNIPQALHYARLAADAGLPQVLVALETDLANRPQAES